MMQDLAEIRKKLNDQPNDPRALRGAARHGDAQGWREALQRIERDWIAPLLAALRQERIGMLSLHALGPEGVLAAEVTRGDLRRFWRRARPLERYAARAGG